MKKINDFWWWWLVLATIGAALFALAFIVTPELMYRLFDWMLFASADKFTGEVKAYMQFIYGVLGAVMFGWTLLILFLLLGSFRQGSRESWQAITLSICLWFVIDTGFSLYTGFWQNGVLNTGFFLLFMIPLWMTKPS